MENILLEAINYVSNISRQKVTVDNISTFLDKRKPNNLDNGVIIKTLQEMQAKGRINKSNRLISLNIPVSNPSPGQVSPDPGQVSPDQFKNYHLNLISQLMKIISTYRE